jgi:hypothetical protein
MPSSIRNILMMFQSLFHLDTLSYVEIELGFLILSPDNVKINTLRGWLSCNLEKPTIYLVANLLRKLFIKLTFRGCILAI